MARARGYRTDEKTSKRMRAIGLTGTAPERVLRQLMAELGLRYRSNDRRLPGRPDVVIPARRRAIFVHGCFWHQHARCDKSLTPARNQRLWQAKFQRTLQRDRENARALRRAGWKVMVIWECELRRHPARVRRKLRALTREVAA